MLRKALFLDRDGVINIDHGYVHTPENCEFVEGIFALCAAAQAQGYLIIIVTNQAGIGRGYYSEAQFHAFTAWIHAQFAQQNITITQTYYCPHHPEAGQGEYRQNCHCRKPQPGMILQAAREHGIDLRESILIGDKESDVQAGRAAGVGRIIRLAEGDSTDSEADEAVLSLAFINILDK